MVTKYDFLVIGSGAGGAALAHELCKKGKRVLIIEKGVYEKEVGTEQDAFRYLQMLQSKEGVWIARGIMAGGTTNISCGNGVRCSEKELAALGIHLEKEFLEAEAEMGVAPIDRSLLSDKGSEQLLRAACEAGYDMELMPKFVETAKCRKCGKCIFGCKYGAKWTSLVYLDQAVNNGAHVLYGTSVEQIIIDQGKAKGVVANNGKENQELMADTVICAAGAIATPIILQKSGIDKAGKNLFIDMLVNTYGVTDGLTLDHEPTMALLRNHHSDQGFIVSPWINPSKYIRDMELETGGVELSTKNLVGFMTKISDEPVGQVFPDGTISKPVTARDQERIDAGVAISKAILKKLGVPDDKIYVSKNPQSGHPGGTAAIGTVVDTNLKTEVDNLYVCDASVFPTTTGLPPMVTITALAKRLAKHLSA